MKKIFLKTAFTLIELIVSTILVVIVVLGIFSIGSVLQNNNQDYGQRYFVKSETQTTLNHILNNVSLAVGSGTTINGMLDQGILIGAGLPPGVGDANTFCAHQGANNNINNSNSDIWLCYTWSNYQINYCTMSFNSNSSPYRGAASCPNNSQFLGTAYSMSNLNGNPSPPAFNPTSGLFTITIQNCLNNTASAPGACSISGTSGDMGNNPEVQISGSVFLSQEGTG